MRALFSLLIALLIGTNVYAGYAITEFDRGVKLLEDKQYDNAIIAFNNELKTNETYAVYYNLGLAFEGLKQYNKSLASFEHSLKLNPNGNEAIFNAQIVKGKIEPDAVWEHPYSWFERFIYKLSINAWSILILFSSLVLSIAIFVLLASKKSNLKKIAVAIAIISIPVLILGFIAVNKSSHHLTAKEFLIPAEKNVPYYLSPDGLKQDEFLTPGNRYEIKVESAEYYKVKLEDNENFWVKKTDVLAY